MQLHYVNIQSILWKNINIDRNILRKAIMLAGTELGIVMLRYPTRELYSQTVRLLARSIEVELYQILVRIQKTDVLIIDEVIIRNRGIIYVVR